MDANTSQCSNDAEDEVSSESQPGLRDPQTSRRRSNYLGTPISAAFSTVTTNTLLSYKVKNDSIFLNLPLRIRSSLQQRSTFSYASTPNTPMIMSFNSLSNEPQSLFVQALSKLNDSPITFTINNVRLSQSLLNESRLSNAALKSGEITPPDSLDCAPPTYSFVVRQITARRRPRLMGTLFPSPSYVQHTPPPSYATAYDMYIDPVPPPPQRLYTFGFVPMPVVCSECGYAGLTMTTCKTVACTHLCALVLCFLCCWVCVPLPYVFKSCKEVYHYCKNCRRFLGMYSPTNPDQQSHVQRPINYRFAQP